jgi:polysaccharide export outer membrane protein
MERAEYVRAVRPDSSLLGSGQIIPVIYHLNMREPQSLFLAQGLRIQPGDVLFVANSQANELRKVLQLFNLVTSPVIQGINVSNQFD